MNVTQAKVVELEAEIVHLQAQWEVVKDRLIVVLKLSGRCTVRSIVEVLAYGLNITVSVGYVQGVIAQAGLNANSAMGKLLKAMTLSGAICIDEVYLKEMGQKIWGIVVVDPLSGLVLRFDRCSDRGKDAIATVLKGLIESGFKEKIKLCLTDMYQGYAKPVATYLPHAVHQYCWFHINCFHLGATVRRAKRAYERSIKDLAAFDKKQKGTLSPEVQKQRQSLVDGCDQARRHWVAECVKGFETPKLIN